MNNSVFQSYSGRLGTGIGHKRGKSGQNEGLFKTTLEEIEDYTGVNSVYNDDMGMMSPEEESKNGHPEVDQTAFIDPDQMAAGGSSINSTESLTKDVDFTMEPSVTTNDTQLLI